jgi:hypothetical protein
MTDNLDELIAKFVNDELPPIQTPRATRVGEKEKLPRGIGQMNYYQSEAAREEGRAKAKQFGKTLGRLPRSGAPGPKKAR